MRPALRLLALPLLLAGLQCADLPAVSAGVCGNGVIEAGEACDGQDIGASPCLPAGRPQACQLGCDAQGACPAGWGCGLDRLCRQASGRFSPLGPALDTGEGQLVAGDVDGDGTADLLVVGKPDKLGQRAMRLLFLDRSGAAARATTIPVEGNEPALADLTGDQRADLVFPYSVGPVVLAGQEDQTLSPFIYPLLSAPFGPTASVAGMAVTMRTLAYNPRWADPKADDISSLMVERPLRQIASLIQLAPDEILLVRDPRVNPPSQEQAPLPKLDCQPNAAPSVSSLPTLLTVRSSPGEDLKLTTKSLRQLAPRMAVGGADTSTAGGACDRVFLPFVDTPFVRVITPCNASQQDAVGWLDQANPSAALSALLPPPQTTLRLPDGLVVRRGALLADLDGDQIVDLLVGAVNAADPRDERAVVAYGRFDGAFSPEPGGAPEARLAELKRSFVQGVHEDEQGAKSCTGGMLVPKNDAIDVEHCSTRVSQVLAAADLNGDGDVDLVIPQGILLSAPSLAKLGEPSTHAIGYFTASLWSEARVGDFNGDGLLDVAAVPIGSPNIEVLLNTEAHLFTTARVVTSAQASWLSVNDVDGDGVGDLIFKEKGPLPDQDPDALTTQQGAQADPLVVGDAVVVSFGQKSGYPSEGVRLGRPGLIEQIVSSPLLLPSSLRPQDTLADIGVISRSIDQTTLRLGVMYGDPTRLPLGPYGLAQPDCNLLPLPSQSVVGRFNDDASLDIATLTIDTLAIYQSDADIADPPRPTIRLWAQLNDGKGNLGPPVFGPLHDRLMLPFQETSVLPVDESPQSTLDEEALARLGVYYGARVAAGDLDNDGLDEVLVMAPASHGGGCPYGAPAFLCNGALSVSKPSSSAGLLSLVPGPPRFFQLPLVHTGPLRVLDLDGDGFGDVLFTTGSTFESPDQSALYVFWNNQGTLDEAPTPLFADRQDLGRVTAFALANVDDDVEPELVVVTSDATFIAQRSGPRAFAAAAATELPGGTSLAVADINRDGLDDLLLGRDSRSQIYASTERRR